MKKAALLILTFVITMASQILACPNCKDAYTPGSTGASIGESYSWSVLFMLLMPIATVAFITFRIAYSVKKNRNTDL
jgi:heme/copper-type cytochrome/quinol oxidase subunit 2